MIKELRQHEPCTSGLSLQDKTTGANILIDDAIVRNGAPNLKQTFSTNLACPSTAAFDFHENEGQLMTALFFYFENLKVELKNLDFIKRNGSLKMVYGSIIFAQILLISAKLWKSGN